jgi:hypothetical protein
LSSVIHVTVDVTAPAGGSTTYTSSNTAKLDTTAPGNTTTTTPKGNAEPAALSSPTPIETPALFDVVSTPVQSTQTPWNVVLSAAAVTVLTLSTIFVIRRIRTRMVERKIKEKMMYNKRQLR